MENNKTVKYIGFFTEETSPSKRNASPAALSKMRYVAQTLINSGLDVNIISCSWPTKKIKELDAAPKKTNEKYELVYFKHLLTGNHKTSKLINILLINFFIIKELLLKKRNGDEFLIYHSLLYIPAVFIASLFSKNNLTLQVEEVYTDVGYWPSLSRYIEKKYVKKFKKYILSTDSLKDIISENAEYLVIHGSYKIPNIEKASRDKNKIKLLYAGIIDKNKAGAFNAAEISKFLNKNFEIHIIGFGDTEDLKNHITKLNQTNECQVYYDGFFSGEKLIEYCNKFDIGLSTQSILGDYVATSFPSKILTYLSLNLRVISAKLPCLKKSVLTPYIEFYDNDSPSSIAEAITRINFDKDFESRKFLTELDKKITLEIKYLFSNKQ